MKYSKSMNLNKALLGAALLLLAHINSSAQTLTLDNGGALTTINSISTTGSTAPGVTDVDGYFFPGSVSQNPTYVATIFKGAGSNSSDSSYTTISINGTDQNTGISYLVAPTDGSYYKSFTINLSTDGSSLPTAFTLGLLDGAANPTYHYNSLYQVALFTSGGTQIGDTLQVNTTVPSTQGNFFYDVTVSGLTSASAGDYLVVSAGSAASNQAVVGAEGFLFSPPATTPEPSTYALLFVGLGLMIIVQRLRCGQA